MMRKTFALAALAFVLYAALYALSASAGCCCIPPTFEGVEAASAATCLPPSNFTLNSPNLTHPTCSDVCNATFGAPIIVPPPAADCSSPDFKPAPSIISVSPVKGQKHMTIAFSLLCPAYSVNISRCRGADCSAFTQIAQIAPTSVFTDKDPALRWNSTYRYRIVATYINSGPSNPAFTSGNPGDIECWYQGGAEFCVSSFYYENFRQYLQQFGYGSTSSQSFANAFPEAVNQTFASRIQRAWKCDSANRLFRTAEMAQCAGSQACVADGSGAKCIPYSKCGVGGLFGLYATKATCEALPFCFFDRSRGPVDACFSCNARMSCADYRSRGACQSDKCNAGDCEWRDTVADIGVGVCVDTRFSNCLWCVKPGTAGMENNASFNEVFDRCTELKSASLSVPGFPCVFNKNAQDSAGCNEAACMDYTTASCGSPGEGITLFPDNSLKTTSTDVCSMKVCQTMGNFSCLKNADGDGVPDCSPFSSDRRLCELDRFAPNTSLVPSANKLGRMDWLAVQMLDKFNATHEGTLMQGKPGYFLRLCVVTGANPCADAVEFDATNFSLLNFNDLNLQAGKNVIATMVEGQNTLKFYGIDNRSNPEVVKNMTIIACNLCQGPKALEVNVVPARVIGGAYYTISNIPVIRVSFNEPATLTTAVLVSGDTVLPVTVSPSSGANYDYTFVPLVPLADGTYVFSFNAKDSNGILMDAPGEVTIVVDTTPGEVAIEPPDGTVINISTVDISFTFTEPLTLLNATLEEEIWISKYGASKKVTDLIPLLTTNDNGITYAAQLTGLNGGKKNLRVHAEDFAGNPTIGKSSFWINTGILQQRMREPTWGVSAVNTFDILVDTTRISECRYLYDVPAAPPVNNFEFMSPFDQSTGVTHTISGFNKIPAGDFSKHKLHVYCKLEANFSVETYELRVDPSPPSIKSAFAQPKVIIERRVPNQDIFTTHLKVQTDDEGFCRYGTEDLPFVLLGGLFSGFDEVPKQSHDAEINVTQDNASYTYYVACKNTAESPSPTVPITFSVDTSIPFSAKSLTPAYSNSTQFSLQVETNKRAFCYIGEVPEAMLTCMAGCPYGHSHVHPVEVNESGRHTWYVQCSTGAGFEVSPIMNISVIVDTTPPSMLYVNDSSNLPEEPEYSYFLDQLQIRFLGIDDETLVNAYYYRVTTFFTNSTVKNWTLSTNTNGTPFYITGLNLTDGNKYKVDVYPVNIVGLAGDAMDSDGVTIDIEKMPEACANGVTDEGETDLDCGGECAGCADGLACGANTDCASGFCNGGVCAIAGCDDGFKNGNETDIDCGGGVCLGCAMNRTCVQNTDCASGACNFGLCGEVDPCADGVLTGAETDIDCGGSCATKCGEGKNCQATSDCSIGFLCIDSTCQEERDSDKDGVKDDVDQCPNTPQDEVADETGCSPSQRFTCNDEIHDGWRIRYFGSVLCDGDGAPTADPDQDGLINAQEFRYGTDPAQPDSDFDGWNDKEEIDAGTNPLDPASHPPSKLRILLWLLLILLLLGAIGVGAYLGYNYWLERQAPPPAALGVPAPAREERRLRMWPNIFEKLRSIARREEPGVIDRDFISLGALKDRLRKEKVSVRDDTFERLKGIISGKIPKKEAPSVMAEIRRQPEAFALLRRVSFEQLTPAEKVRMREQLKLMKAGKLTAAEIEEILSKLRVTASYYKAHRKELERELEKWLGEGKKR